MTPLIRCALCQKLVDRVEWYDDHVTLNRVIRVHCHGDTDTMSLTQEEMFKMYRARSLPSEGEAFITKRLMQADPKGTKP